MKVLWVLIVCVYLLDIALGQLQFGRGRRPLRYGPPNRLPNPGYGPRPQMRPQMRPPPRMRPMMRYQPPRQQNPGYRPPQMIQRPVQPRLPPKPVYRQPPPPVQSYAPPPPQPSYPPKQIQAPPQQQLVYKQPAKMQTFGKQSYQPPVYQQRQQAPPPPVYQQRQHIQALPPPPPPPPQRVIYRPPPAALPPPSPAPLPPVRSNSIQVSGFQSARGGIPSNLISNSYLSKYLASLTGQANGNFQTMIKPILLKPSYGTQTLSTGQGAKSSGTFQYATSNAQRQNNMGQSYAVGAMHPAGTSNTPASYKIIPLYGYNPYSIFGKQTYGPLPKPAAHQQPQQQSHSYSYGIPPKPTTSNSGYGQVTQAPPSGSGYGVMSMGSMGYGNSGSSSSSGSPYGSSAPSSGSSYGGSSSSSSSGSSYGNTGSSSSSHGNTGSSSSSYGSSQSSSSGYGQQPMMETCGFGPSNFCNYRQHGHYTHPMNDKCFIQCDAFGKAYPKPCPPGTRWRLIGPEPAMFSMCT